MIHQADCMRTLQDILHCAEHVRQNFISASTSTSTKISYTAGATSASSQEYSDVTCSTPSGNPTVYQFATCATNSLANAPTDAASIVSTFYYTPPAVFVINVFCVERDYADGGRFHQGPVRGPAGGSHPHGCSGRLDQGLLPRHRRASLPLSCI